MTARSPWLKVSMADTDRAVDLRAEKEGRRLRALRECFHRALKLALECPAWEVGKRPPGNARCRSKSLALSALDLDLDLQEFAACFTDLPEHYTVALFDLYQQVSTSTVGLMVVYRHRQIWLVHC